jgi:hypothetical protein
MPPMQPTFTPRKAYPKGKLRDITKAQSAEFFAAVCGRMAPWPITNQDTDCHPFNAWTVPTKYGPLTVTVYAEQDLYFSVYCQFRGEGEWPACNDDPRLPEVRERFDLGYSCKWNVLENHADAAMNCLEYRLLHAGAQGDTVGNHYS